MIVSSVVSFYNVILKAVRPIPREDLFQLGNSKADLSNRMAARRLGEGGRLAPDQESERASTECDGWSVEIAPME